MKKHFLPLAIISSVLVGCATPAQINQMSAQNIVSANSNNSALKNNVTVQSITGGKATNPLWTSQVSSADFQAALESSLKSADLLASNNGSYLLDGQLLGLKQPMIGLDMTVTATVKYQLLNANNKTVVLDKTIVTPYTATVGDAFYGVTRLRMANEGAIRSNLEEIVKLLQNIQIADGQVSVAP